MVVERCVPGRSRQRPRPTHASSGQRTVCRCGPGWETRAVAERPLTGQAEAARTADGLAEAERVEAESTEAERVGAQTEAAGTEADQVEAPRTDPRYPVNRRGQRSHLHPTSHWRHPAPYPRRCYKLQTAPPPGSFL